MRKKADQNTNNLNQITTTATLTYQDSSGNLVTNQNQSNITKVLPLKVKAPLRGRDVTNIQSVLIFDFVDNSSNQSAGEISADSSGSDVYQVNWTSKPSIDPNKNFDLRISSPGYLSRKLPDISLLDIPAVIESSSLVAGDVNQDHKINWQDYIQWKAVYGQSVTDNPNDFNGDKIVDYKDYAVSFGTRCYNASEANQDTQCNQ